MKPLKPESRRTFSSDLAILLGSLVVVIGGLGLIGHLFNIHILNSFSSINHPEITLPVIFALIGLGISSFLVFRDKTASHSASRTVVLPLSLLLSFGISIYWLIQYWIVADFNIIAPFIIDYPQVPPAFLSMINILISTAGLLILQKRHHQRDFQERTILIGILGLFLLDVSIFALFGHLLQVESLHNFTQAIPESIAFLLLGLSLLLGSLPYQGLLSPCTSKFKQIRLLSLVSLLVGSSIIIGGLALVSYYQTFVNPLTSFQAAETDKFTAMMEYAIILFAVASTTVSLRTLYFHDQTLRSRDTILLEMARRKKVEESLRTSEQRFQLMVDNVKDYAIFMLDSEGKVATWNQGAQRMFGYSGSEIIGQSIQQFYSDRDTFLNTYHTELKRAQEEGHFEDKGWRVRKDGLSFWALVNTTAIRNKTGELLGYAKIVRDLTDRMRLESQIKEARDKAEFAETASQKRNLFFSIMSHELRTPLNAIVGYTDMLESGYGGTLTEKQKHYVHNVSLCGAHLLEMINDILDLSKIEAGKLSLKPQFLELCPLIMDVESVVSQLGKDKNIQLSFSIPPDLDGMEADPARLRQILLNLISNAVKFNKVNGMVNIRFFKTPDQQNVVCQVEDTGIGIPEDKLSQLFQEFYQIDTSHSRAIQGTGLGLALTKKLVELHGGTISVKSIKDEGTTFTFTLPTHVKAAVTSV